MKLNIDEVKSILLNKSLSEIAILLKDFDFNTFDKQGNNILHYYVKSESSKQTCSKSIIQLLIDFGIDINAKQSRSPKRTALEFAVLAKSKEAFDVLLANETDVNVADEDGNVALFYAIMGYRGDDGYFIETLISKGAQIDIVNNYGISPKKLSETIANYDSQKFFK